MAEEPVYKSLGIDDKTVKGERSIMGHMSGIIKAPSRYIVEKVNPFKSKNPVENLTSGKRDEYKAFMSKNRSLRKDDQESLLKKKFENVPSEEDLNADNVYYKFNPDVSGSTEIQYLGKYEKKIHAMTSGRMNIDIMEQYPFLSIPTHNYIFTDMHDSEISSLNDIYTLKNGQELTENDRAIMKPYVYNADYQRKGGKRATKKLRRKRAMKKSRRAYKHKSKKMRGSRTTRKRRS